MNSHESLFEKPSPKHKQLATYSGSASITSTKPKPEFGIGANASCRRKAESCRARRGRGAFGRGRRGSPYASESVSSFRRRGRKCSPRGPLDLGAKNWLRETLELAVFLTNSSMGRHKLKSADLICFLALRPYCFGT